MLSLSHLLRLHNIGVPSLLRTAILDRGRPTHVHDAMTDYLHILILGLMMFAHLLLMCLSLRIRQLTRCL